jgi:hypothetical protein
MRKATIAVLLVMSSTAWSTPALAQNSPPNKPESDCGVTTMCLDTITPAHHGQVPLWAVELAMFAGLAVMLLLAYRLLLVRRPTRQCPATPADADLTSERR